MGSKKLIDMLGLRRSINLSLAVGSIAVGGIVMTWLVRTKPSPPMHTSFARVPDVAVVSVEPTLTQAPVVGYGTVRPKNQVNVVPQVSGKLIYSHEDLAQGNIIPSGDLLFEIDSTVYEARVRQAEAETHGHEGELGRLDQEVRNLDTRIANVEQMLSIDEKDYLTSKQLYEVDKVGTERSVDQILQKYLRQKGILIELKNRRAIVPHLKLATQAQLESARARLQQAQHNLANTKIACPFKARVELVGAHASQVVTAHFSIATLTDMEAFEISVGIDPRELRWLSETIRPDVLGRADGSASPEVTVNWSLPGQEFAWRGFVTRFERVDEVTRTARMVVEVRETDMVATLLSGSGDARPSLSIGMHCRAELPAEPLAEALVVPRHAIYDHRWVYVFEPDGDSELGKTGCLGRRAVPMLRALGDHVLVDYADREGTEACELKAGERLVVSPLMRPVVGMKVELREERVARGPVLPVVEPDQPKVLLALDSGHPTMLGHLDAIRHGG